MKSWINKKRIYKSLPLFVLLWFVYNAADIRYYSKHFFENKSDVAIVLGAGTASGKLSHVYEQRVLHAIDLLKREKVKKILFTGGYGEGQKMSDSRAAANYAMLKGVQERQILMEEKSTITFHNIEEAKKVMEINDLKTALVISDPYHMKRSMKMCEKVGIKALPSPTPTTMYRSRKTKFNFLLQETFNYCTYQLYGRFRSVD